MSYWECKPADTSANSSVLAVSIKLPDFYTNDLEAWFSHVEVQFGIRSVTNDDTKFWCMLASLDAETSTHASRVVRNAKASSKYQSLKDHLIKTYTLSRWERAERILSTHDLGDRKPSAPMNHLFTLLGSYRPEILLQHVFMRSLPSPTSRIPLLDVTHLTSRAWVTGRMR